MLRFSPKWFGGRNRRKPHPAFPPQALLQELPALKEFPGVFGPVNVCSSVRGRPYQFVAWAVEAAPNLALQARAGPFEEPQHTLRVSAGSRGAFTEEQPPGARGRVAA